VYCVDLHTTADFFLKLSDCSGSRLILNGDSASGTSAGGDVGGGAATWKTLDGVYSATFPFSTDATSDTVYLQALMTTIAATLNTWYVLIMLLQLWVHSRRAGERRPRG
jgi:hypothetical protein